jgi:hypothetical protein
VLARDALGVDTLLTIGTTVVIVLRLRERDIRKGPLLERLVGGE